MKKIALLLVLAVLLSSACANGGQAPAEFWINVENKCKSAVYGFHLEYYLSGEPIGGMETMPADGSAFGEGEIINFVFTEDLFPEGADLTAFSFELFVMADSFGHEAKAGASGEFSADYGREYGYTVSGDAYGGFRLS